MAQGNGGDGVLWYTSPVKYELSKSHQHVIQSDGDSLLSRSSFFWE